MNTLVDLLKSAAEKFPQKTALQMKKNGRWEKYSFGEFYKKASLAARRLAELGIGKGDCAALIAENSPLWGIGYFGIIFSGAAAVPVDTHQSRDSLFFILTFAEVKAALVSSNMDRELGLREMKQKLNLKVEILILEEFMENLAPGEFTPPKIDPSDTASIIFTSGTTGDPKGVMLSHRNFISDLEALNKVIPVKKSDRFLSVLPLYHVYEFTIGFLYSIFGGASATYVESLKANVILENMVETRTTVMPGIPILYNVFYDNIQAKLKKINPAVVLLFGGFVFGKIRKAFGGSIRFLLSGGAKLDPEVEKAFNRWGFNLLIGYGLTETAPLCSYTPIERKKYGTIGVPLPGIEMKIDNPDENGNGEILVKGSNVMKGYYKNDASTKEVLRDGWFYTGDIGKIDGNGYFYITGRSKEIIVTAGGKNVYPDELEQKYSALPHLKEICIFGMPTEGGGEEIHAVIVPKLDGFYQTGKIPSKEELFPVFKENIERRSQSLPGYQRIKHFDLWLKEELPKTTSRKVKRFEVVKRYRDRLK